MAIKRDAIFNGIALLAVGILFLIAPTATTKFIYGMIGLVIALAGALRLIAGIRFKGNSPAKIAIIVQAVVLLILGIFLLINPDFLIAYNYIIFGLIMIINGIVNIFGVIRGEVEVHGNKIIYLILSALLIVAGVIVLAHPVAAAEMLTIMIGVMLIISGLINLFIAFRMRAK